MKKEKYVEKVGITGTGKDYNIYKMSIREKVTGFLIGFALGAAGMQIMFGVFAASIILGAVIGILTVPVYKKHLHKKQRGQILSQFRDLLDSLSNSFSAGKNTPDSFSDALNDMKMAYGKTAPITREVDIIVTGLQSNFTIEDLLKDMALRCGLDDIKSFADTFSVCNRLGGNLKKVVSESRDIINSKIEIEMEIQTIISSNKNEMNIMAVMPFIIVSMMGMLGQASITANTPLNVIVKLLAIGLFVFAYVIGRKMTEIQV